MKTSALNHDGWLTERAGSKTYLRVGWLPDEELRVMLASGHDLHVAAFASGAWNDDFVHHFIGRGIGCKLSFAVLGKAPVVMKYDSALKEMSSIPWSLTSLREAPLKLLPCFKSP